MAMAGALAGPRRFFEAFNFHRHIIWALLMREMNTRYGRNNIGYLWLIVEPMIFCTGVTALYSLIRAPFEYGMTIAQFTITGYMPMIMFRQGVGYSGNATRANNGLLYHRRITPLHLFMGRFITEFCGTTLAYIVIVFLAHMVGVMPYPKDILLLLGGWLLLALQAFGCAMFMNALSEIFEFVERFIAILTYLFLPISGFMFMMSNLPSSVAKYAKYVPFVHCFEMMRGGYFGRFLPVTYDALYAFEWGVIFTMIGLVLQAFVRPYVEVH
jgi:capsular polysaccharide transport system permease protein